MDGAPPLPVNLANDPEGNSEAETVIATCPALELELGIFFDGTGNNMANVLEGNARRADGLGMHSEDSYNNDLSNVAKLYRLHSEAEPVVPNDCGGIAKQRISMIVDGIGTTSGQDDSLAGFAVAWGASGIERRVQDTFVDFLRHINTTKAQGEIRKITVDVFGFSRGAAAARHFVNCVHRGHADHGYGGPSYEVQAEDKPKIEIRFLGLFDTVVSWGRTANDVNHGNLRIGLKDDSATKIVHITALDEFRENFPLTKAPDSAETIPTVGAHADIGGGYPDFWVERPEIAPIEEVRILNTRRPTTPEEIAALEQPSPSDEPLRLRLVVEGWIRPEDRDALQRKFLPVGSHPYDPYYIRRYLHRPWMNHRLSHVALHVMHDRAVRAGVSLPASLPDDADHAVPPELQSLMDGLLQGDKLDRAASWPYRRDFVHHSAHWSPSGGFIPMKPREGFRRSEYPNPEHEAWDTTVNE